MTARAKLFKNGRSQAVRLPAEFRFKGTEVFVRRDEFTGDVVLSERKPQKSWDKFFRLVDELDLPEDFMLDRDQGTQERENLS